MSHYRKIEVNGKTYEYRIGWTGVTIRSNPKFFVRMDKLTGRSWNDLEDYNVPITPADIRNLIEENKIEPAKQSLTSR